MTPHDIATQLNLTTAGLRLPVSQGDWSDSDDAILAAAWLAGKPAIEICHRLDRTLAEVSARRLVLSLPDRDALLRPVAA